MKIADVEAIALAVPMKEAIAAPISIPRAGEVASVVFKEYRSVVVRVTTDDGITGVGECMTRLSGTALRDIVHYVKPLLVGKDPRDVEYLWVLLWSVMINRGHHKGFYPEAMAGIDTALWDVWGKSAGVPVWRLLGGRTNPKLRCYASSPHGLVREGHGPSKLGRVPGLTVPVRQHRPEPSHGGRGNRDTELRDVPLQESANESLAPRRAVGVRRRQVRARKSAPQPEPHPSLDSGLREIETRQLDELDPAGQRLGDSTHEFG